jgi:8-oxo-dGTP pyrophosphatase MutT (NUDIX family)
VDTGRAPSAVLIPLYLEKGCYQIVFIKRTDEVKTHKGQVSFPGGMRDEGDKNLLDTALREAYEEIGLARADVNVIGELDDELTTTSSFIVTPFVASIPWPYDFTPNKTEVARIINVPLAALLEKGCFRPEFETLNGEKIKSFAYYYEGTRIWGATARILNKLLNIIEKISA